MATCADCIHSGICEIQLEPHYLLDRVQKLMRESDNVEHECLSFKDSSRFVELPDDFPNKRLTTNEPQGNFENLMNYAYDKNSQVTLRYGAGKYDIDLAFYVFQESDEYVCPARSVDDIMEGACFECENNCSLGILYSVATQAAELRARLKMYEDLVEQALKERDRE